MEWIILLIILLAIILSLLKASTSKGHNYRLSSKLFSPAERSFLGVIDQAISDKYRVFGKVRVADIITPAKGMSRKNWQIAFNKIAAKHFDYVLCSKDKLEVIAVIAVIAVIELDDKSHSSKKSQKRDSLLENACNSAQLELIRFKAKSSYQVQAVREQIETSLNKSFKPVQESSAV